MKKILIGVLLAVLWLLPAGLRAETEKNPSGPVKTKSFNVNKGDQLVVYVDEGDIIVRAWEKNEAFVQVSGLDDRDLQGVNITQAGQTVRVDYSDNGGRSRHVRFEVSIPSTFNMNLETSGGDIQLQNAFTGTIKGETSGGDIRF